MNTLITLISTILPIVILLFFIYFLLLLGSIVLSIIRVRKQDKTMKHCMTKAGIIVYGVLCVGYVLFFGWSIYDFVMRLAEGIKFFDSLQAFNLLTAYTVFLALFLQDFVHVGRRSMLRGNKMFEFRRMKKIEYPKKHKATFIYGQKQFSFSTWFVDITEFKKHLVNSK